MMEAFVEIATHGGKQAIAAPRGRGKSEITKGMLVYLVCAGLIRFPIPVCQTTTHAGKLYKDFRKKLMLSDELAEDFPEMCYPCRALEGAPQRASKQHIDHELTNIEWTVDALRLADVPAKYRGPIDYGGVRMEFRGLDAAIRGVNSEGDRPDFVIIDDPETRGSAKSDSQIEDRENAIEQDIEGLAGEDEELAQVMLTTIQNRKCISFRYTDPDQKPSWMGKRFAWVEKWPTEFVLDEKDPDENNLEAGLWNKYIDLRQEDQRKGDRYGRTATEFFLENREAMEDGGELLADNYKSRTLDDGWVTVHSAWQVVFNAIADGKYSAFCTEYQNNPLESEGPQGVGLTANTVLSRISGLSQKQVPANAKGLTAAIDLGKYRCHWVVTAWWEGAGGTVVDYGVAEVTGTEQINEKSKSDDLVASEPHIYRALLDWREKLLATNYVDATGAERKIDCVFVDSGTYTNAAYEFCRQVGGTFHPSKGVGRYRPKIKSTEKLKAGDHMHAQYMDQERLWLFELDPDYWKNWVHERFLTPTFDEDNFLRRGALSIFTPEGSRKHTSFAQHIVAEELVTEFVEGKGSKTYWHQKNKNNHWLDALYNAACAGRYVGIHLLGGSEVKNPVAQKETKKSAPKQSKPRHGPQVKRRPGGWMRGIERSW